MQTEQDTTAPVPSAKLLSSVEAVIFSSDSPVSAERLRAVFAEETPDIGAVQAAIDYLIERYDRADFGIQLRRAQGGYQFVTKVEAAELVRKFHASKPFKLSRSALETLAIIAYRQPITRAEIDQIRGIDSSHMMRTLIERALVKMAGKADVPGRPVQYATTERFLEILGLQDLGELPPLSELEQIQGSTEDPEKQLEQNLSRFIERDMSSQSEFDLTDQQLVEIGSLIESAVGSKQEIFLSSAHAEVVNENRAALEAFLAATKRPSRWKTTDGPAVPGKTSDGIQYEELVP